LVKQDISELRRDCDCDCGKHRKRIVNLTDLRAFLGHAGVSQSLIVSFGTCSFHDKYEKFCVKLTVPVLS